MVHPAPSPRQTRRRCTGVPLRGVVARAARAGHRPVSPEIRGMRTVRSRATARHPPNAPLIVRGSHPPPRHASSDEPAPRCTGPTTFATHAGTSHPPRRAGRLIGGPRPVEQSTGRGFLPPPPASRWNAKQTPHHPPHNPFIRGVSVCWRMTDAVGRPWGCRGVGLIHGPPPVDCSTGRDIGPLAAMSGRISQKPLTNPSQTLHPRGVNLLMDSRCSKQRQQDLYRVPPHALPVARHAAGSARTDARSGLRTSPRLIR